MPTLFFWTFALLMLASGIAVVALRNPVSSAMSVVACFVGMAGLFVGLNAYFVAIVQILVYTGAIIVLFVFIIMLLDLRAEARAHRPRKSLSVVASLALLAAFSAQVVSVVKNHPNEKPPSLDEASLKQIASVDLAAGKIQPGSQIAKSLEAGRLPDTHLIGRELFTRENLPLQILGVLLLVATVGVVALSRRDKPSHGPDNPA